MILKRQDHRIVGRFERSLGNCFQDVLGLDFRDECVAVNDDGFVSSAVPEVQLYTAAACQQALAVHFN